MPVFKEDVECGNLKPEDLEPELRKAYGIPPEDEKGKERKKTKTGNASDAPEGLEEMVVRNHTV